MPFERSQMLYNNGYYKWTASADHDNPYYKGGTDYSEINKTEGYEVLYFLNHIGKIYWSAPNTETFRKMERILRFDVPSKSTHKDAEDFIIGNWSRL